jgi:hypothetical protein
MPDSEIVLEGRLLDDDEKQLFSQIRSLSRTFVSMVNDGRIKLNLSKVHDGNLFLATPKDLVSDTPLDRYVVIKSNGDIGIASGVSLDDFQAAILIEEAKRVKEMMEETIASSS